MEQTRQFEDGTPVPEWATETLEFNGEKFADSDSGWQVWSKGFSSWEGCQWYESWSALDHIVTLQSQLEAKTQECERLREVLKECEPLVCAVACPITWKDNMPRPHSDICHAVHAALKEDGNV